MIYSLPIKVRPGRIERTLVINGKAYTEVTRDPYSNLLFKRSTPNSKYIVPVTNPIDIALLQELFDMYDYL